ncbi:hypothetical protein GTW67_32975, partial [Streptomyces sp. SID5910]|nr:hypothetical protein [Streptomyces sp. SID5910]
LRDGSTPDGATPGPSGDGTTRDEARGGTAGDRDPGDDRATHGADGADGRRRELAAYCHDVSAGKTLDDARRRALREAAGGSARVEAYCRSVLADPNAASRDRTGAGEAVEGALGGSAGDGRPRKGTGGDGDRTDKGGKSDKGDRGDKGGKDRSGDDDEQGDGKRGDDDGDEDDGPRTTPRAHGTPALRPAHTTGAPTSLLPLPGRLPQHDPQDVPRLGKTA